MSSRNSWNNVSKKSSRGWTIDGVADRDDLETPNANQHSCRFAFVFGVSGARGSNPSFKLGKLALNRSTSPASLLNIAQITESFKKTLRPESKVRVEVKEQHVLVARPSNSTVEELLELQSPHLQSLYTSV